MLKDLLPYVHSKHVCICIFRKHNRFYQFHDSTHGISVIPIGWKMSSFQKVYQNPIVIQLTSLPNTKKKAHTFMQMSIFKCVYISVLYTVQSTHMWCAYDSVLGLTEKVSSSNRKMKWKVSRILGKNFSQNNNNAHLCMFVWVCALVAPILQTKEKKNSVHIHSTKILKTSILWIWSFSRATLQFQMWNSPNIFVDKIQQFNVQR